jgi:malate/lactate dehydrogenase
MKIAIIGAEYVGLGNALLLAQKNLELLSLLQTEHKIYGTYYEIFSDCHTSFNHSDPKQNLICLSLYGPSGSSLSSKKC